MAVLSRLAHIDTFIFDVDGVLTNNDLLITEEGEFLRIMNTRDGFAIKHAILNGYFIGIITGGRSEGVVKRLEILGVQAIYTGIANKMEALQDLCRHFSRDLTTTLYMGDDLPDLEVMKQVALPACPNDAIPLIQQISAYVSPYAGGKGCVRDVLEKCLTLQGKWNFA